jgi:predicted nucleotidyltransferase
MRLTSRELNVIRTTIVEFDRNGRAWLFGSRADDSRRGGDIDLYLETSHPVSLRESLALEYRLASLCGTKVDLLVRNPGQTMLPIHEIAREGVPL